MGTATSAEAIHLVVLQDRVVFAASLLPWHLPQFRPQGFSSVFDFRDTRHPAAPPCPHYRILIFLYFQMVDHSAEFWSVSLPESRHPGNWFLIFLYIEKSKLAAENGSTELISTVEGVAVASGSIGNRAES